MNYGIPILRISAEEDISDTSVIHLSQSAIHKHEHVFEVHSIGIDVSWLCEEDLVLPIGFFISYRGIVSTSLRTRLPTTR
jgi:hypothetical protein